MLAEIKSSHIQYVIYEGVKFCCIYMFFFLSRCGQKASMHTVGTFLQTEHKFKVGLSEGL